MNVIKAMATAIGTTVLLTLLSGVSGHIPTRDTALLLGLLSTVHYWLVLGYFERQSARKGSDQ